MLPSLLRRKRFSLPAILLLCGLVAAGVYYARRSSEPPALAFSDFLQQVNKGEIVHVQFADGAIAVKHRDGSAAVTVPPPNFQPSDAFITNLTSHGVRINAEQVPAPGLDKLGDRQQLD